MLKRASRLAANNAIALAALFLALGGASYAATGALSASNPQYKACVGESHVVVLKTGRKPCGKGKKTIVWNQQGPAGAKGANGVAGATGPAGATGANGLSALSTLPSGASESGEYSVETGNATAKPAQLTESESFSIPLATPIDAAHVQYLPVGATVPNCPGVGHAAPGFLCLYSGEETGLVEPEVFNFESRKFVEGTGRFGFSLQWTVLLQEAFDAGVWTVTAP
jgi:hypothetical protein